MERKIRLSLSEEELGYLEHILWHFTDYMAHDDRPDHGLGILKQYRNLDDRTATVICVLAGRLRRLYKNTYLKNSNSKTN